MTPLLTRSFELRLTGHVVFGPGTLARLGELTRALPVRRVLLITDAGLVNAGIAARALAALEGAGLAVSVHDAVREEPREADVRRALNVARSVTPEALVVVGGGSSIDTAKAVNLLLGGGRIRDYRGPRTARGPLLPIVAVPTTAGTGSEMQSYALIAEDEHHRKLACGDPGNIPRIVILDPDLLLTLPPRVAASAGADALVHALECAVTRTRNPASQLFAEEAFRLLAGHLEAIVQRPDDPDTRAAMLLGATWAGQAIELSMLGAAHAAANPLSAHHAVVHGHAVALMAPHVVRYNACDLGAASTYVRLATSVGWRADPAVLADELTALFGRCGLPTTLRAAGIASPDIPMLAADASSQWTGQHNPLPVDPRAFASLYRAAS